MISILLLIGSLVSQQIQPTSDLSTFVDLIDSLQPQIKDFQCEYEGTNTYLDPAGRAMHHLGNDGLYETFSGVYIWSSEGNTFYDAFRRKEPERKLIRDRMVVRGDKSEHYYRLEDEPMGDGVIDDASFLNPDRDASYGGVFLTDTIKRRIKASAFKPTLEEARLEDCVCTLLTFRWKETGKLYERYWIDVKRGGHVVQRESYYVDDHLQVRTKIRLCQFPLDQSLVWMPIEGNSEAFVTVVDRNPIYHEKPVSTGRLYVNFGTMRFNKRPPASTFNANYKPGTPITDQLNQSRTEFGQQKNKRLTRAEAEAQLHEQLAIAQSQKTELVAGSPSRDTTWVPILPWVFGTCALIGSTVILILRRR